MASGRSDCAVASRLERGVPWSTAVSVASMAGRSTSMHGWHTCTRRLMVGSPSRCPFFFLFFLLAARSGVGRIRLCVHRQSTESRRVARGSSTNMVGVSLCLSPRIPRWQLQWTGPACLWGSVPGSGPSRPTAHLTSPINHHPPAGHFFLQDFPLPSSSATAHHLTCSVLQCSLLSPSLIFLTPHDEATGSTGAFTTKTTPLFLSLSLSRLCFSYQSAGLVFLRCHHLGTLRPAPSLAPRAPAAPAVVV